MECKAYQPYIQSIFMKFPTYSSENVAIFNGQTRTSCKKQSFNLMPQWLYERQDQLLCNRGLSWGPNGGPRWAGGWALRKPSYLIE
jgi:hypothetical protein